MKQRVALFLSLVFLVLAVIHFYWALGGEWGLSHALPTNEKGAQTLSPTLWDSLIIGMGLFLFSLFYVQRSGYVKWQWPKWLLRFGQWLIPSIFMLRAIGDFHFFGFFKVLKSTQFAVMDTWLYSPLCLWIGVMGFGLIFWRKEMLS
ncbi:DUF3995 domain-containing protein [Spongiimicrobium salis]|uniref:DUF3995 domain-containing protein n=1 Tax=Spongiimicrobium salis TaxID=1667022 RepID=UPI00374D9E96